MTKALQKSRWIVLFLLIVALGYGGWRWATYNPDFVMLGEEHKLERENVDLPWISNAYYVDTVQRAPDPRFYRYDIKGAFGQKPFTVDVPSEFGGFYIMDVLGDTMWGYWDYPGGANPDESRIVLLQRKNGEWRSLGVLPDHGRRSAISRDATHLVGVALPASKVYVNSTKTILKPTAPFRVHLFKIEGDFVAGRWPTILAVNTVDFSHLEADLEVVQLDLISKKETHSWTYPRSLIEGDFNDYAPSQTVHPFKDVMVITEAQTVEPTLFVKALKRIGWGPKEDLLQAVVLLVDSAGHSYRIAALPPGLKDTTISACWIDDDRALAITADNKHYVFKVPLSVWRRLKDR